MKLLVLSDLHENFDFERIDADTHFDLLICLGDLYNIDHDGHDEINADIESIFATLLQTFKMTPHQVLFIPGNHDPEFCFDDGKQYKNATNLHLQSHKIKNIQMRGSGGSVDSYFVDKELLIWRGYPYSEAEMKINLQSTDKIDILLSHQGPSRFGTTDINKLPLVEGKRIDGGSKEVRNWILTNKPRLLIHGHTHFAKGMLNLGDTLVVNPGAYRDGYYCIINYLEDDIQVEFKRV